MPPPIRPALLLLGVALATSAAGAQPGGALRVFLDCDHGLCDFDVIREEVAFVDYVRDIRDADVYALSVTEPTGNGTRVTLFLEGRGPLDALADTLRAFVPDATPFEVGRRSVVDLLRGGLPRYFAYAGAGGRLRVTRPPEASPDGAGDDAVGAEGDPWRGYTLNVGVGASASGEQRFRSLNVDLFGGVSRRTEDVKVRGRVLLTSFRQSFEVPGSPTFTDVRTRFRADGRVVWSDTDRLSYGVSGRLRHDPFSNVAAEAQAAGAFEYSLYPYAEASRRQLALAYEMGLQAVSYSEETVFGRTAEVLPTIAGLARAEYVEEWGSLFGGAEARQRPFRALSFEVDVSASVRLARGLSLDVTASYEAIRDQRALRRGEATPEEVLLRLRELDTGFRYSTTLGLSYTFGSKFAGAVNPRFGF